MAKSRKKKTSPAPSPKTSRSENSLLTTLEQPRSQMLFLGLVFLLIIALYKPIVFDGLDSSGSDVIANIGNTHALKQFEKQTGERSLWNPNIFSGMPFYHRHNAVSWSIDTLINAIDPLLDWRVWYLWLGALGIFLLMRYLELSPVAGILGSLAFILLPHSHALIVVGHFSKLRALMWIPYVTIAFMMLLNSRSVWSMLLFAAVFALQLRTQHYQIVFYTILLLAFIGFAPYIKMLTEKRIGDFLKFNGMFLASIVLLVMIVAQPLLVTRDYTPYSTRGGQAINIYETVKTKDTKGVGFDYATNWSYTLAEFWNLVIPKFHGGTSNEGIRVPKLNNQQIPAYWGDLPFTQSYEYLGVIIALLALIGIVFYWHSTFVKSLTALTVLALLLSLGKHFAPLYKLFFYYLPFFDKFRVPMMILTLVSFNAIVLAGYGITALINNTWDEQHKKRLYVVTGAFIALIASPLLFGGMLALSNANEFAQYAQRYGEQQARQLIEIFREARLEVLRASTLRTLFLAILGGAAFWMMSNREKTQRGIWGLILVTLVTVDLGWITANYLDGKFVDLKRIEQQNYRMNQVDRIIKQDQSLYRILPPLRIMANDSRWPYYHQSIGGYDPAKMQVMQDLIANNILDRENPQMPINLEVVAMLNGKYIVSDQTYEHPQLTYLGEDPSQNLYLYRNELALPRAFFVDSVVVLPDGVERLKYLNRAEFDPAKIAVLEAPLAQPVHQPDSCSATVTYFSPNKITIEIYASQPGLLVISEIFYPKGWKATLENGENLPIYKTNHALRSVYMPAGQHTLTLAFAPATYYNSIWVSWIGWLITYLGLAYYGWRYFRKEANA